MERNYRNREFEEYLKENVDQYRMFPSESVWRGINSALHSRRKWYGFGLGFLLLLTGTAVTWVMITYPAAKNHPTQVAAASNTSKAATLPQQPFSLSEESSAISPENSSAVLPFSNTHIPTVKTQQAGEISTNNILVAPEALIMQEPVPFISVSVSQPAIGSRHQEKQTILVKSEFLADHNLTSLTEDDIQAIQESASRQVPGGDLNAVAASLRLAPALPVDEETALERLMKDKKVKKIGLQLYFTPTVSYRKLSQNESFDNSSTVNYPFATLSDVNKAVTHKPDMGLQVGLTASYPMSKNLKIRGGLQFNINRYDIKAFAYNPEVATINLADDNGISSVSAWTPYRNFGGFKSDWLKNFYFSVSAPIGIELKVFGNDKTNFGIAGTIQPTYIIKDRAYLISTDYKNYAKVPWLIRHLNVNTGFEAFVNYTSGKTKWQIGPQVRYQILSSFHNKYPVKENLFDFGVKLGVSLNNE